MGCHQTKILIKHSKWCEIGKIFAGYFEYHHTRETGTNMSNFVVSAIPHYDDVRMGAIASQITSLAIVYSAFYSGVDQRKHQSSASLAFVWGIHRDRWIPRTKGQLRGKCFHFMTSSCASILSLSGPWFNIKMLSYQYRKSHCGDKTVVRSSYLHNGISYTGKISSLYWFGALMSAGKVMARFGSHMHTQQALWGLSKSYYAIFCCR